MILPTAYFPSVSHFALIAQSANYQVEAFEHFVKQSYRSRCEIYGANGKLNLVVPLKKWRNHSLTKEVEISYDEPWQKLHWKSIESAYRTSPYFEFYEEDIKPLFQLEIASLLQYNLKVERELKEILSVDSTNLTTVEYQKEEVDWRKLIHPKHNANDLNVDFPKYIQVFEEKSGFIPNLSILDLLFNLGPNSKTYLEQLRLIK